MNQRDLIARVVEAMEGESIPYIVVGSVAAMLYGEPRMTQDVDVAVLLDEAGIDPLLARFPESEGFYASPEAARAAVRHKSRFNILHPAGGKIDVYVLVPNDHDRSQFARARKVELVPGVFGRANAPDDVILKKLEFIRESGHERHVRDIAGIIRVSGHQLDWAYLDSWAERLNVRDQWNEAERRIPRDP